MEEAATSKSKKEDKSSINDDIDNYQCVAPPPFSKGCPNCDGNPQFLLIKSKNAICRRKLENIFETHHCCDGDRSRMEYENTADLGTIMSLNH